MFLEGRVALALDETYHLDIITDECILFNSEKELLCQLGYDIYFGIWITV